MRDGFLVVDKPEGLTSHDIVGIIRAATGEKSVGHTGTLDPFATGVLALAVGSATRLIQYLDESYKVYDATIRLGVAMDTGDPTGAVLAEAPVPDLDDETVARVLEGFLGEQMQAPPAYSAVKVDGKPLYWYARRGKEIESAARPIVVHALSVISRTPDTLRVKITCGRGTYARVLAEEISVALGTVGHLIALARLRSGPFEIADALSMDALATIVAADGSLPWRAVFRAPRDEPRPPWNPRPDVTVALDARLVSPLSALSHVPLVDVDAETARKIRHGQAPTQPVHTGGVGERVLLMDGGDLVAIAEIAPLGFKLQRVVQGI